MRRKLTIAMLLLLSVSSLQALALGVGEVSVHSPLNAPLRATIPLTDTSGLEPELLRVLVAEPREFESAGLSRSPLVATVRTAVQVREGQLVVELFSERAVREPWLDLVLSFEWPGGRQLREITLLLDPPDYDQLPVLVGLAPAQPGSTAARSAPEPVRESPSRPVVAQSPGAQSGDPAWVSSGDTLWAIADRLRPDSSISTDQMMVALVEANPDIFPTGNINAMRAGHSLVVPPREAIAARSTPQAGAMVQAMNQAWASRGSGAPARVPLGVSGIASIEASSAGSTEHAGAGGELGLTNGGEGVADEVSATVEEAAAPRLTLLSDAELAAEAAVSPEQSGEGGAGGGDTNTNSHNERAQVPPGSRLDPEVLALLDAEALVPRSEAQRLASLERRWLESQNALAAVQAERDVLQGQLGGLSSEVEAMREQLAELIAGGQGVDGPGLGDRTLPGAERDATESNWWGGVYQDGLDRQLMLGGAGLAALLGLWLLMRRRRYRVSASTKGFANMPSVTYGVPAASTSSPPVNSVTPIGVAGMSVSSAESSVEQPAPMPQAEAISEADIFMAYGRYDQARESLLAGLSREPGRDDLRLKLLTTHVRQGDWVSADREARRLVEGEDPATAAEVSRLMAAHREVAVDRDDARDTAPTELTPAREMPPEECDSQLDPQGDNVLPKAEPVAESSFNAPIEQAPFSEEMTHFDGEDVDAMTQGSELQPDPLSDTAGDDEVTIMHSGERAHAGESSTVEWDMIDYQPPPLDPEPGRREETPMQPSIDFATTMSSPTTMSGKEEVPEESAGGERENHSHDAGRRSDTPPMGEEEWEVEEVAFPPLERDNEGAGGSLAEFNDLEEAQRLLDVGATERAHALLQRLRDGAADPRLQAQARELLTHYRL